MNHTNNQVILDVEEKPKALKWLALSFQHLFAMFGATVLVPFLVKLDPSVALISSGIGTITFLLITRGKVPAYLGSSFAFIAPLIAAKAAAGPGAAMVGSFLAGVVYAIVALLIKFSGYKWILRVLPPIVVGPVIMVIGLSLAGTAVNMAMNDAKGHYSLLSFSAALLTLAVTIICSIYFKGFFNLIPVLIGIAAGYIYSLSVGLVDFAKVTSAPLLKLPDFIIPFADYTPALTPDIIFLIVPIAVVTISEHIGHQLVLSKVVGRNYIKDPGLHSSLFGDGVATMIAACLGGPPSTTYGENIGVLAITRVYSVFVIAGAAIFAILFGFVGTISAFISSIPQPVMGGVSILLFGIIASSGLRMMIDSKIDIGDKRNLIISSVILVIGIGGAALKFSDKFELQGMALAAIIGVILNLVLPGRSKEEIIVLEEDSAKKHTVA
ncbi:solute carrier family 23 protein [Metabacillus sp. RGM 3146]|uniref:solute carrier family 23 protein n=1 Tax=Metabacillus sp. RGM 3146 TaxID=3401092 RepID=UPI003B9B51B4